jgi:hypothetical protein
VSFRFCTFAVCLAAAASFAIAGAAAQESEREAALKAAFLYNFAKFTEWHKDRPDADAGPVVFCVGPDSSLRGAVAELQGKLVGSRPVRQEVLAPSTNPAICHVLFVDDTVSQRLRQLAQTDLHGVLTVSDLPDFARAGGNIGFLFVSNQLRFQINLTAARRSGIAFISKLLRLADVIGQESSLGSRFAAGRRSWVRAVVAMALRSRPNAPPIET